MFQPLGVRRPGATHAPFDQRQLGSPRACLPEDVPEEATIPIGGSRYGKHPFVARQEFLKASWHLPAFMSIVDGSRRACVSISDVDIAANLTQF